MTNLNESWWFNTDNNAQTNRAINEFSASTLAAQQRLRSSIDAQGKETKNLADRLDRVERAILAVVALEDARELLAPFQAEQATRTFARDALTRRAGHDAPEDVAGYWLAPAARAVAAWASGGDGAADVVEARRRDAERSDLFVTVASALAGRDTPIPAALVPPVDGEVTSAQRTIWVQAAAGRFGAAGRRSVTDALRSVVSSADPVELRAMIDRRLPIRPGRSAATERLEALRVWLTTVRSTAGPAATPEPDIDPMVSIVDDLIGEGTEPERPLLEAVGNARAAIEALTSAPARALRPQPGESRTALAWLISDIDGSGTSGPALRSLAVTVLAGAIDDVAVAMAEEAARAPATPARPATPSMASGSAGPARDTQHAAARRSETLALVAAAVCVVGVILGAIASPAWFILSVAGGVLAGVLWSSAVATKRSASEQPAIAAGGRTIADPTAAPTSSDEAVSGDLAAKAAAVLADVRAELHRFERELADSPVGADAPDQDNASSGDT